MLQLNLLPEKEKIEFRNVLKFRFAVFFSIWFFFCFFLFLSILIFSNYYLRTQISNLETKFNFEKRVIGEQRMEDFENVLLQINKNLVKIKEIKDKSLPIYDILKDITSKSFLPAQAEKIKFQSIVFSPNLKEVNVVGFADSRDELLRFKENIENGFYVQLVDLPIQFLVKQKDIDFALKIKIK